MTGVRTLPLSRPHREGLTLRRRRAGRGSGLEWTVLRPGWFAQNFSEDFWLPTVRSGTLALPAGEGRVPLIDAEDIADVAVAALTGDRPGSAPLRGLRRRGRRHRLLELSGHR